MRDVQLLKMGKETLVVASDNSGAIGLKKLDAVQVPYDIVGYYTFRVAAMECYSAGAIPEAVILQNFCGEEAWEGLVKGITRGLLELDVPDIPINGSTESNFALVQSAVGLSVLGKRTSYAPLSASPFLEDTKVAVIGLPLVGNEVIEQEAEVAPLRLVKELSKLDDAVLLPVGSKGILYKLNRLFSNRNFLKNEVTSVMNIEKTSGPSTCFLIAFPAHKGPMVKELSGHYYHELAF
ncbi:ATP-binding protein [Robertmurraya korlensis]|uniref:ATP-binding protein n=1 Tax=Robertmurraya korlensis TaxID=519977 RepID=UPI002041E16C|nr:ATP-binding protein [Robertmurraya korlensis]MCM3600738.1 ATP-binding protein [Robertmurraya korlensis]